MLNKTRQTPAYRIDARTGEITDITIGDYKTIYKHIGEDVDCFTCVAIDNKGTTLYLDDEGLLKNEEQIYPWWIQTHRGAVQLVGNAVVLGTSRDGNTVRPKITKEALKELCAI